MDLSSKPMKSIHQYAVFFLVNNNISQLSNKDTPMLIRQSKPQIEKYQLILIYMI